MPIESDNVLHSKGGRLRSNAQFPTGQTSSAPTSSSDDVIRILTQAVTAGPKNGLVVHFHGGLVDYHDGIGIAKELAPYYSAAGSYPLFFVWEAGLFEALRNNKAQLLQDPAFREFVKKVSEWVLRKIGTGATLKGTGTPADINFETLRQDFDRYFDDVTDHSTPPTERLDVDPATANSAKKSAELDEHGLAEDIYLHAIDDDPAFVDAFERLAAQATLAKGREKAGAALDSTLMDADAQAELLGTNDPTTTKKGVISVAAAAVYVAKIVIKVLTRYQRNTDHGMYCTVVEEVLRKAYMDLAGAAIWRQMKLDTQDSFGQDPECCGSTVVNALKGLDGKLSKITLVGHSTGAIYICSFLDAAAVADVTTPIDVVFLAPAVSHRRFAAALASHRTLIRRFRMFGMLDELECADKMLPPVYTRSLLYFVSGLLEGDPDASGQWAPRVGMPLVGMRRYLDKFADDEDVRKVAQFLESAEGLSVWSDVSGTDGLSSSARKHGDFDNDGATLASLKHFIAT
ncbi:hypothetical protein QTH97_33370 [Variovorax sp. J22R24]|uniref:hypothetical protein n=1 Tax=Variovorax gracilis TaxID=3053502 RepID=UPI00257742A9|nr:hypothetical protein [Variovorax sp. J22R24]MDM0109846.1 hypothetical protein [Variovorax sp. J22R24]